jgi:uncharacterized protein (TIRG00374 family)
LAANSTFVANTSGQNSPIRLLLNPRRLFVPILIGVGVAGYILYKEFDAEKIALLDWGWQSVFWLLMALVMVAARDVGYMYRIRYMTDKHISWRRSFDVIMLWEFASALSPSVVGGSAVAMFIVQREGIKFGKSTAIVMCTAFLDELFYILTVPVVLLVVGTQALFPVELQREFFGYSLGTSQIFYVGYFFIVALTAFILSAIFFFPQGTRKLIVSFTFLPVLRRWRRGAIEMGNDLVTASRELKGKPWMFWAHVFGATAFSWTARFWVVNCLIMAIGTLAFQEHMMVYARQLVMWVIMLISPTPGSSGVAEFLFNSFLGTYIPHGLGGTIALLWRLFTYYPYLFIGVIVLPGWITRVYLKRKLIKFKSSKA